MKDSLKPSLRNLSILICSMGIVCSGQVVLAAPTRTVTLNIVSPSPNTKTYPYSQTLQLATSVSSGTATGRLFSIDAASSATNCSLSSVASSGPTLTASSSGTCVIKVTLTDGVTNTATFTFTRASQSGNFGDLPNSASYLDSFLLQDFVSFPGKGAVSLDIGTSTACTISDSNLASSTLRISRGTGTCQLTASIAQDTDYFSASTSININVSRADRTLSNPVLSATSKSFPYTQASLSVTSVSGGLGSGALSITGVTSGGSASGCSWNNASSTLSSTSSGTCIVNVRKAQDENYNVADVSATFTFLAGPSITSYTPLTFKAGDLITISGGNLTNVTKVRFGTSEVLVTPLSATQIKVPAPSAPASGFLSVVTSNGDTASSTVQFTITASTTSVSKVSCPTTTSGSVGSNSLPLTGCQTFQNPTPPASIPTITGVTKASTSNGDTFTIVGMNLRNPSSVEIGSTRASVLSATSTQIVARIPTSISGSFVVTVVVNGKTATFTNP